MLMAVPMHECRRPPAGLLLVCKGSAGVLRPVFGGAEQRLRVGVVVRDPRPGERAQHPELLQPHLQRGGTHGAAVIGVQDQPALAALADPLPDAGAADQSSGQLSGLAVLNVTGHDLAAPDIDYQIEVQPDASHAGGQVGDVPASELIGTVSTPSGHWPWLLRPSGPSAALHLLVGVEHAVEAALGGNELAQIGQVGHDLGRWQRGVVGLVTDRHDPLPLLVTQPMGHVAGAAFAAVPTVPITHKLASPALQGAQADAMRSAPAPLWPRPPRRHRGSPAPSGDQPRRSVLLGLSPEGLHLFL
jgi:hypothetical protein